MKIHTEIAQNSVDWAILRSGKVTASEMDALVTPLGKVKTGDGPRTYLMKKVAEAWLGGPLPSLNVWDMEQGQILEEFARPAFALETGLDVETVGFITGDNEKTGCSPDGVIYTFDRQRIAAGVEIKCPRVETHIGYLLDGTLPKDYVLQVQGSLYVTGFPKWYFYSFCRRMPSLILEVLPDPEIQESIDEAVKSFLVRFDEAFAKLVELNGGVRPEPRAKFAPSSASEPELDDILN